MPQDAAGYHTAPTRYRTFAVSWKSRPRTCNCRPLEVTRADSRDQHVQTPEVAKQDKKGQKP